MSHNTCTPSTLPSATCLTLTLTFTHVFLYYKMKHEIKKKLTIKKEKKKDSKKQNQPKKKWSRIFLVENALKPLDENMKWLLQRGSAHPRTPRSSMPW